MMKKFAYFAGGIVVAASMATIAGQVTGLNTFTSGTTISSSEVNANFSSIATAVNDNDSRIAAIEAGSTCPSDMVPVGPICVDIYEAVVEDVVNGGYVSDLATAALCNANGNDCKGKIVARSVAGQVPTTNITWFQAQQACAAAGKRLLTNAEWQMAAAGTDDSDPATTGPCNIGTGSVANTDANPSCISNWGVVNMVGNVQEWVADWVPGSGTEATNTATASYGSDVITTEPATNTGNSFPAAVYRGGGNGTVTGPGVFTYSSGVGPDQVYASVGFRCAK